MSIMSHSASLRKRPWARPHISLPVPKTSWNVQWPRLPRLVSDPLTSTAGWPAGMKPRGPGDPETMFLTPPQSPGGFQLLTGSSRPPWSLVPPRGSPHLPDELVLRVRVCFEAVKRGPSLGCEEPVCAQTEGWPAKGRPL